MTNGVRPIATAAGAMLADPACLGNLPQDSAAAIFDPEVWRSRGELREVTGGRGSAWFIESGARRWALRHFRRGGFIARWSQDRYVWAGEDSVRAFAEWRLLDLLWHQGLPVPKPVAARYVRSGWWYTCDLITQRIVDAQPLSALVKDTAFKDSMPGNTVRNHMERNGTALNETALNDTVLLESQWRAIGAAIARLHGAGVDHADLNAHNILIGPGGVVSVIDFDRGRLRKQGGWAARNLQRLHRSLLKISRSGAGGRFSAREWQWLLAGYGRG